MPPSQLLSWPRPSGPGAASGGKYKEPWFDDWIGFNDVSIGEMAKSKPQQKWDETPGKLGFSIPSGNDYHSETSPF